MRDDPFGLTAERLTEVLRQQLAEQGIEAVVHYGSRETGDRFHAVELFSMGKRALRMHYYIQVPISLGDGEEVCLVAGKIGPTQTVLYCSGATMEGIELFVIASLSLLEVEP